MKFKFFNFIQIDRYFFVFGFLCFDCFCHGEGGGDQRFHRFHPPPGGGEIVENVEIVEIVDRQIKDFNDFSDFTLPREEVKL